ncbi:MAG: ammonia-forming cytochrome c nitrite reductase subunit c552 [Propionibacteriaceae bacterium]|nr:ammonia-forming cytochrome c nitrite reductase subunit c552 [Propionibacteriaceae bacterium]
MSDQTEAKTKVKQRKGVPIWALVVIVIAAAGVTFLITALITNVAQHKGESAAQITKVVNLDYTTYDPKIWGQNFPNEYDGYLKTTNFTPTAHNPALVSRDPATDSHVGAVIPMSDPRTETTASKLTEDPRLVTMWSGYAFAIDYRHLRGHAHMLEDQRYTLRVLDKPQPGACLNCHCSLPEVLDNIDSSIDGDVYSDAAMAAWAQMNKMTYGDTETKQLASGPVACIDCHDPNTMQLRVVRPAFINGIAALKKSEGIDNYNVNKDASTQEMRSFVCAQCHVEYYMGDGDNKTLTFPWAEGIDIDNVYQYYQDINFSDFTHALTGAPILKAQHPEFESWSAGVHAANGVACADCHMAYQRVGAQKISNHDVTTPMVDVNGTCGKCHAASEEVITNRVTTIQNRYLESRDRAMDALTQFIDAIKAAKDGGASDDLIQQVLPYQTKANFYMDMGYSENSYGFHAPDYFQRIFNESMDASRQGQLILLGVPADQVAPSDVAQNNLQKIQESGLK